MQYFYIETPAEPGGSVVLSGQEARHMCVVLRHVPGDTVCLFDRDGNRYQATLVSRQGSSVTLRIDQAIFADGTSRPLLILCQAIPKAKKMDWIVQKAVELGVDVVVPFRARRSVPVWDARTAGSRRQHWQNIALAAVKQSGPRAVPEVTPIHNFGDVVTRDFGDSCRLLLWEQERDQRLRNVLGGVPAASSMVIMIGPEGGLCEDEVALARQQGFLTVGLGAQILRTETAPVAVLSIVQYTRGWL